MTDTSSPRCFEPRQKSFYLTKNLTSLQKCPMREGFCGLTAVPNFKTVIPGRRPKSENLKSIWNLALTGSFLIHWLDTACGGGGGRNPKPETLHPTPYTSHSTPYTLHPAPCTLHPTPYTLHSTPYTLHPTSCTLHPTPCTLHRQPYTLHLAAYTLRPRGR